MARIELLPEVFDDLDRILDHLARHDAANAPERVAELLAAIDVLTTNPMIGRPARDKSRELVIGKDSRGYVALYRFEAELDAVFVLAIRAQREAGYRR